MGIARVFVVLCACALCGCVADETGAAAPQSPSPVSSGPSVIQNTNYTTNVYGPATINAGATPDATAPVASNGETNVIGDSTPPATSSPYVPDTGEPTGAPECDRYLARVSSCSHRMLSRAPAGADATKRIDESLSSARRAWRSVLKLHPEMRATIAQQCIDAQHMYDSSVANRCD